jgi:predicted acyltransferase
MRINSIDAVRGLTVAAMLLVNDAGDWSHIYPWLEHAHWHGCTPADFIFPVFMLIVGVSLQLALGRQLDANAPAAPMARAVMLRGARIVLLGVALNVVSMLAMDAHFRLLGVLQRTGICFALAGLIAIYLPSARAQWAALAAILLGYWALLSGSVEPNLNLADRIDTAVLGALLSVRRRHRTGARTGRHIEYAAVAGHRHPRHARGRLAAQRPHRPAGYRRRRGNADWRCWSLALPLNKQLWTSSFVLWTGGFGMLAIALAYQLIDVRGWPPLGRAMGVNAITAYAGSWLATCALAYSGVMGHCMNTYSARRWRRCSGQSLRRWRLPPPSPPCSGWRWPTRLNAAGASRFKSASAARRSGCAPLQHRLADQGAGRSLRTSSASVISDRLSASGQS